MEMTVEIDADDAWYAMDEKTKEYLIIDYLEDEVFDITGLLKWFKHSDDSIEKFCKEYLEVADND